MSKELITLCACSTSLAHIFMVAQALEEAVVGVGYKVRIGTQGVDGIQDRLTVQDIIEATIIIRPVAVAPEDNKRSEPYGVYEVILQDAIKSVVGIVKEIKEIVISGQR